MTIFTWQQIRIGHELRNLKANDVPTPGEAVTLVNMGTHRSYKAIVTSVTVSKGQASCSAHVTEPI